MGSSASPPTLAAHGIAAAIGRRTILSGIELSAPAGRSLALVGPNGCGKSTLIRVFAGLQQPAAGIVRLDGADVHAMSPRRRAHLVGVVAQDEQPPPDQLVGEYVALGRTPHINPWARPGSRERHAVFAALEQVGMADFVDRPLGHMSGGERRRVVLARGLAQETPLLFLDEPTNHLDIAHQLALLDLVRGLGKTVVAAVHDLDLAAAYFDDIALLHDGRLLAAGPPMEVLGQPAARHAFRVRVTPVDHPLTDDAHLLLDSSDHPRRAHPRRHHPIDETRTSP